MRFYSDVTKKVYDTEEALLEAENLHAKNLLEKENRTRDNEQKLLKVQIELDSANKEWEDANKKAEELSMRYLKEIDDILVPARKKLEKASEHKRAVLDEIKNSNEHKKELDNIIKYLFFSI